MLMILKANFCRVKTFESALKLDNIEDSKVVLQYSISRYLVAVNQLYSDTDTRACFSLLKDGAPKKVANSVDRFLASIPTLHLISEKFLLLFVLKGFIDYLAKFFSYEK